MFELGRAKHRPQVGSSVSIDACGPVLCNYLAESHQRLSTLRLRQARRRCVCCVYIILHTAHVSGAAPGGSKYSIPFAAILRPGGVLLRERLNNYSTYCCCCCGRRILMENTLLAACSKKSAKERGSLGSVSWTQRRVVINRFVLNQHQ